MKRGAFTSSPFRIHHIMLNCRIYACLMTGCRLWENNRVVDMRFVFYTFAMTYTEQCVPVLVMWKVRQILYLSSITCQSIMLHKASNAA